MRLSGRLWWGVLAWMLMGLASAEAAEAPPATPADSNAVNAVTSTAYIVDPSVPMGQMTELQNTVLSLLKIVDRTYNRWVNKNMAMPNVWLFLATDIFAPYTTMPCTDGAHGDAPFILRARLAAGVSYLYAAIGFMEAGQKQKALEVYERGLAVLEDVVRIGSADPDIAFLPNYTTARLSGRDGNYHLHPLAGLETVLTGVTDVPITMNVQGPHNRSLVTNRNAQSMLASPFMPLETYQAHLTTWYQDGSEEVFKDAQGKFKQGSTVETARFFLAEFCPWGLGMYRTLKDAGLTKDLDWRILRPFAGDEPQDISVLDIFPPQIPKHIVDELNLVIGDGSTGYLDLKKTKRIDWAWVGKKPTFTIKYVSPLVYERVSASERFSQAMGFVKWVFGGPVDYLVDAALGGLLDEVGKYYGKDNDIYHVSWVLVHGNDKGLLTTDFVTKRELPSITLILKKTAGAAFVALEQQIVENMYEGIDPKSVAIGTTYNGQPIPPIMIRGDVLGFQKVPAVEYLRTIQAVRHYVLRPAAVTRKNPTLAHNLKKNEGLEPLRRPLYLQEQQGQTDAEVVRKNAWQKLPTPFGGRDYVNDFSPAYQIFKINLPAKDFKKWTRTLLPNTNLYVQLHQPGADEKNRLILNERIHEPALRLVVYNMHSPQGKNGFIDADMSHTSATRGVTIGASQMHPKTYRYFGPSDHRRLPVDSLALELTNRLQTRYQLVVTKGKDGPVLARYRLVIAPGRGAARTALTGALTVLDGGGVVLDYDAPAQLPTGSRFMGEASGPRYDAWLKEEVRNQAARDIGMPGRGTFELGFIVMQFNEQGQCVIDDFKYNLLRAKALSDGWYRRAHVTVKVHCEPAQVTDPARIEGRYTCIANAQTSQVNPMQFRSKDKQLPRGVQGTGAWTLEQEADGSWFFQLQPDPAPLPEMMAPIEATLEEE